MTPKPLTQGPTGAWELFKVIFDTEKEVHHVCFVTYQAKITWATSFQVPEVGSDGPRLPQLTSSSVPGCEETPRLGVVAGPTSPTERVPESNGYMLTFASRATHLGSLCRPG